MGPGFPWSPPAWLTASVTRSSGLWGCRWRRSTCTSRTCGSATPIDPKRSRMTLTEPIVEGELRFRLMERYRVLDGLLLRLLTEAGMNWLRTNAPVVNALNVFPVPDVDTGTNMTLTMQSA